MKTQEWFGINLSSPLSLENRWFAELVRRLSAMDFQQDDEDKNLYHFTSETGSISVRITYKPWEEGRFLIVEFLDETKKVLLLEQVVEAGFPSTYGHHPLVELVELVKGKYPTEVALIKTIDSLLGML